MFAPAQEAWEDAQWAEVDTWSIEVVATGNNDRDNLAVEENLIMPEIDAENPENTDAPILVTEDWEIDEMDQTIEVQLENGETEIVRQWDLWDAIQIAQ